MMRDIRATEKLCGKDEKVTTWIVNIVEFKRKDQTSLFITGEPMLFVLSSEQRAAPSCPTPKGTMRKHRESEFLPGSPFAYRVAGGSNLLHPLSVYSSLPPTHGH